MHVTIHDHNRNLVAEFDAADFNALGTSPDHFDKIAPAYLAPLTAGAPHVDVTYADAEGTHTERHFPNGTRDGEVVGTRVTYLD